MKNKTMLLKILTVIFAFPAHVQAINVTDYFVYNSMMQQQQAQQLAREHTIQKEQELQLQQQQNQLEQQKIHNQEMERCKTSGRLICF